MRDLAPEVAIVDPLLDPKNDLTLAAGDSLSLTLAASDPDYKLASLKLIGKLAHREGKII